MKKLLSIFLLLIVGLGLVYEAFIVISIGLNGSQIVQLLSAWGILFIAYALPLIVLARHYLKKHHQPAWILPIAILVGAGAIGPLSGLLNFQLIAVLKQLLGNNAVLDAWAASIAPPIVEETLKMGVALLVIVLFSLRHRVSWLVTGLGVGLGFQLLEDHTYFIGTFVEKSGSPISQAISRLDMAYASHWLLTAVMTLGVATLIFDKASRRSVLPYLWVIGPSLLHAFGNNPFTDEHKWLLVIFVLLGWALLWTTRKQAEGWKSSLSPKKQSPSLFGLF
ncbi:PrsW family glutamic-type intramembrane protease [Streptococcus sp. E17BB]|uniref:PrsW family glutamic-type intramembrane protease n=1 Tax=Streptococcus sp. E17BB TaxID=3278714 RepID=UPI00359CD0DD